MAQQDITGVITVLGGCLQRFSANLGLGTSPTTVEFNLVPDDPTDPNVVIGGSGFDYSNAVPGKILSFSAGSFRFIGFINSWLQNNGPGGWNYTVRTSDPRSFFNTIPVILDSSSPSNLAVNNCLNPFNYYGGPMGADATKDGMSFRKVRDFLTSGSGNLNLYGYQFKLRFSSGYFDSSGTLNPTGVPEWYRLSDTKTNLSNLIDNVSRDLGFDYWANIDYNTFNPTGVSIIDIKEINRNYAVSGNSIAAIVSGAIASGTVTEYSVGQELRTDHIGSLVFGDKYTYWYTPGSSQILPYWGRANDGSAIYPTDSDRQSGMVLLDHITGSGAPLISSTISIPQITITQSSNPNIYPPTTFRVYSNLNVSGYRPTTNVMRAALISQSAWEAVLFKEQQTFAQQIGISVQRFMGASNFVNSPASVRAASNLVLRQSDIFNRPAYVLNLIQAVYEATRNTVGTYWGKQFIVDLPTSPMFVSGQYDHSELYPTIDYSIAGAANCENLAYPSGITNHAVLLGSHNSNFKDELGRLKPFFSMSDYNLSTNTLGMPVDTSLLDRNSILIEQGDKLVTSIGVEQYEKFPIKAIISVNQDICGKIAVSGQSNAETLGEFQAFLNLFGYGNGLINQFSLLQLMGTNSEYRLAAPRMSGMLSAQGNYGVHIPLQRNFEYFGPFMATGVYSAGLNLIQDSSIAPWTYGSVAKMLTAGQQLADRSVAKITVIDHASFNLAGLPEFNIGDPIGVNANMNNISMQYGTDGLTTSYNISTFALPSVRISKLLSQQISKYYYLSNQNQRQIVDLNKLIPLSNGRILRPNDVPNAVGQTNRNFSPDNGYFAGVFKPQ